MFCNILKSLINGYFNIQCFSLKLIACVLKYVILCIAFLIILLEYFIQVHLESPACLLI